MVAGEVRRLRLEGGASPVVKSRPTDERRQTLRLWYALEHVFGPRNLKIVLRNVSRNLMIRSPVPDRFKVKADVLCVDIWEGLWVFFVPPDLTEECDVHCTYTSTVVGGCPHSVLAKISECA